MPVSHSHFARPVLDALERRVLMSAELVRDINRSTLDASPSSFASMNGNEYFFATDGSGRVGLWATDGTDAGTRLVKDLFPAPTGPGELPKLLPGTHQFFFFLGGGLWRSDGTNAGTRSLGVFDRDDQLPFAAVTGDTLFFGGASVTDPSAGRELWKSDGTAAGTVLVKDVRPGAAGSNVHDVVALGDSVLFSANDGTGYQVWRSDGTAAGTTPATALPASSDASFYNPGPVNLTAVGGATPQVFFTRLFRPGTGASDRVEVWRTDGSVAGTQRLGSLVYPDDRVQEPTAAGDAFYFLRSHSFTTEVWRADATGRLGRVSTVSNPHGLAAFGDDGTLLFAAGDAATGVELWKTTGTAATTARVADIAPGSAGSSPHSILALPGAAGQGPFAVFAADDGVSGTELWRTDGTAAGTIRVVDLRPGFAPSSPVMLGRDASTAYFSANDGLSGVELFRTDGTAAGTRLVSDINKLPASSSPSAIVSLDGVLYFSADDGASGVGRELWRSDGTSAGTRLVKDIYPGADSSGPDRFTPFDGELYFANEGIYPRVSSGIDLWKTDGTEAGTVLVKGGVEPQQIVPATGKLFFTSVPGVFKEDLWVSDGTTAGTRLINPPGVQFEDIGEFAESGGKLFFVADDGTHGYELWTTDGTAEGTSMVLDLSPAQHGSWPRYLIDLNGTLLFQADTTAAGGGFDLWHTDGTAAGTTRVASNIPGGTPVRVGDAVLFFGPDSLLWKTDGTAAGTVDVKRLGGGGIGLSAAVIGNTMLFSGSGPEGHELWKTDGTEEGTVLVKDIAASTTDPWRYSSTPSSFVVAGGKAFFLAADAAGRVGIWQSDGTEAGTQIASDLVPTGGVFSRAYLFTPSGGNVYFSAVAPQVGEELWKLPAAPAASVVARHVFYNRSGFDLNDAAANAADDGAVAPDKNALLAGQDRLPGFDNVTSYDKGLNGLMVDIANLPAGGILSADDFDFGAAGAPISVTVRRGAGAEGSDRVTLIWRDYNPLDTSPLPQAVGNGWLTVTVKANADTGLSQPDVFSFGNLIGETGDAGATLGWRVNALDLTNVKRALNASASLTAPTDFNRDRRTNALDLAIVKRNLNHSLGLIAQRAPALAGRRDEDPSDGVAALLGGG